MTIYTVLHIIKLTLFPVLNRFRSISGELKYVFIFTKLKPYVLKVTNLMEYGMSENQRPVRRSMS